MHYIKDWKDRVCHRHKKTRNATPRHNQTETQSDITSGAPTAVPGFPSSITTFQAENPHPLQDLWQLAYDQLDTKEQDSLSRAPVPTQPTNDKRYKSKTKARIEEVIRQTEEQYRRYREGGLKIQRSTGEEVDLRRLSQRIINAALSFNDIISKLVTFDPTQHAASAWAVVSLGLTMTKNRFDLRDALFDSSEYLADILARCAYIEETFYHNNCRERVETGCMLVRVYKAILQYAAEVSTAQMSKMASVLDSITGLTTERLTDLRCSIKEEVQDLHQQIQLDQHLCHNEQAERLLVQIDNLRALVQRFSLPIAQGASYDAYDNQHEGRCLPDTRVELRCHISQWAESIDSKCIFWLNGMAGTGKSTIARTIAETFEEKGQLGGSFFSKRQLMAHDQQLAAGILRAVDNDPDISAKALREQFDKLLLQPLGCLELNQNTTLVIVVDALDECEQEDDIRVILQLLPQLQKSKSMRVQVFLTSRPELPIRLGFEKNNDHQDLVLHDLPNSVIEHDIRLFLEERFSTISKNKKMENWPGCDILNSLVKMAVPLFIFAATICRFVEKGKHPDQRLQRLLDSQAPTSASQMDKLYLPVLNQVLADSDEEESDQLIKEFRDIVGVIIVLATPLSVNSLAQLLGIPMKCIRELLDPLYSVLYVPEDINAPIRVLHLSFRDYLLNTMSAFCVDEAAMHQRIASHCLRVMNAGLKHNICELPSYGAQRMDLDDCVVNEHLPADLQYSCRYWVHHLVKNKPHTWEAEVLSFLKKHFLHWLEAMSLMGTITEVVGMINTLQSNVQGKIGSELSEFLYDAKRFLLKNIQIAGVAPLQFYCSGLLFSPMESTIRKALEVEFSKRICLVPQMEHSWSAELQTLEGHCGPVHSVAFSPDGQAVASSSGDQTVKLWDASTGKEQQTLQGHSGSVLCVAFSPDGQTVASSSDDKTVKLWDATTGKEQQILQGHCGPIHSVAFSPDSQTVVTGSDDKTVKLWDASTGKEQQTLQGHSDPVLCVAFSMDSQTMASGSFDQTVKLWDITTGKEQQTLQGHSDPVLCVAFSPDSQTVASSSTDMTVKLWDITTSKEQQTLERHFSSVHSVAFSQDGQTVASGSFNGTVKLWDITTGKERQILQGHSGPAWSVAFSPNGQTVASSSDDKTVKLWDAIMGKKRQTLHGHCGPVWSMAFSPDGQTMASGSFDQTVKLWDATKGIERQTLQGHSGPIDSVTFSLDSQILVSTSSSGPRDQTVKLWDATTGIERQTLQGHSDYVHSVAFSPDGQTVVTGSDDKTVKLWDATMGKERQTLQGHSGSVVFVAFSPDGQTVTSGSTDMTVKLWDIMTGKEQQTLQGHSDPVLCVAFSPDSQIVASGSTDETVKLWDITTGKERQTLQGHSGSVFSVAFSPDGQTVASSSRDKIVKVWDVMTGRQRQSLQGRFSSAFAFSHTTPDPSNPQVSPQVSLANEWVTFGGERLLWLPTEYRSYTSLTIKDGTLALGYYNGRVIIVGFYTPIK